MTLEAKLDELIGKWPHEKAPRCCYRCQLESLLDSHAAQPKVDVVEKYVRFVYMKFFRDER